MEASEVNMEDYQAVNQKAILLQAIVDRGGGGPRRRRARSADTPKNEGYERAAREKLFQM